MSRGKNAAVEGLLWLLVPAVLLVCSHAFYAFCEWTSGMVYR